MLKSKFVKQDEPCPFLFFLGLFFWCLLCTEGRIYGWYQWRGVCTFCGCVSRALAQPLALRSACCYEMKHSWSAKRIRSLSSPVMFYPLGWCLFLGCLLLDQDGRYVQGQRRPKQQVRVELLPVKGIVWELRWIEGVEEANRVLVECSLCVCVQVCKSGVDSQDHLWSYGAEIVLCRVVFFACGTDPGSVARAFSVQPFEMCQLGAQFLLTVS